MTATEIWFSRVEGISTSYDTISACSECGALVLDRNESTHRVWHDAHERAAEDAYHYAEEQKELEGR